MSEEQNTPDPRHGATPTRADASMLHEATHKPLDIDDPDDRARLELDHTIAHDLGWSRFATAGQTFVLMEITAVSPSPLHSPGYAAGYSAFIGGYKPPARQSEDWYADWKAGFAAAIAHHTGGES